MKKMAFFLLVLIVSFTACPAFADGFFASNGPILILGDSMTKGDLGLNLHKLLSEKTGRQIISIGIGGAGSADYLRPRIVNNCCGYIIRENAPSGPIENIENSNTLDNATVGQKYDGNLSKLLQDLRPSSVLILLGTNQKNAHAALVAAIRAVVPNAVIAWAGPPLLSTSPKIYSNLASSLGQSYPDDQKALESNVSGTNSKVQIINCEHFAGLGDPKETMLHYAGTQAALLASDTIAALK